MDIRDAFFEEVYEIASKDRNVMFLTADMGAFGISRFKNGLRSQYLNLGVAEQNMVNVAAGLALEGKKVFIYTIASFITQRCYEQIKLNLCDMCLPVTIVGAGPGLSYGSDGPTHHSLYDIPIMRVLPEMMIVTPTSPESARKAARIAYERQGPTYVRLGKDKLPETYGKYKDDFSEVPFVI